MNTMPHIDDLADKNTSLLKRLGFDPLHDDPFSLDDPAIFQASGLFSPAATTMVFSTSHNDPPPCMPAVECQYSPDIAMLLVRPDMLHIVPRLHAFMSNRFTIIESKKTEVTPDMYWEMYQDAVISRETVYSRLTRAAVYIGSRCHFMAFSGNSSDFQQPVADYAFQHLKGKQGVIQPGTIRGDIVYQGAIQAGAHILRDKRVARALDPFGAYRKIVNQNLPGNHRNLAYPLLFYTGVGVHIPNFEEMQRDLTLIVKAGRLSYDYTVSS